MKDQTVILDIDARGVATITLNRPDKHNAFDDHLIANLTALLDDIAGNAQVRLLILCSSGKNFSAGADLAWMRRMAAYNDDENLRDATALAKMLHTLNYLPMPTLARVQGAAMGGGAGLVCCCDIAIAADTARFAFSETRLGLIPATISPYVLQAIGPRAARRYFLTAERFSAEQARTLGMVAEVVRPGELDGKLSELTDTLLQNSPQALTAAKQLIFDIHGHAVTDALMQMTSTRIAAIRASEAGKEGLAAFLEKRSPAWAVK